MTTPHADVLAVTYTPSDRKRRALLRAAALLPIAAGLLSLRGYHGPPTFIYLLIFVFVVGGRRKPRSVAGRARLLEGGVALESDAPKAPPEMLVRGQMLAGGYSKDDRRLVLARDGGAWGKLLPTDIVTVDVESEADAQTILERLGLGQGGKVSELRLRATQRHSLFMVIALALFFLALAVALTAPVAKQLVPWFGLAVGAAVMLIGSRRVTVGSDGFEVHDAFGRRDFVAYGAVTKITPHPEKFALAIERRDGPPLYLEAEGRRHRHERSVPEAALLNVLADRIREGVTEAHAGPSQLRDVLPPVLAAGPAEERVRAVVAMNGDYRMPAPPVDVLLATAADARIDPETRATAALAACRAGGDEARAKVRVVAAATAESRVRAALETMANEGAAEDEVTEALRELSPTKEH